MAHKTSIPDTRRGTALWGLNRLREDALVRLMHDLVDVEIRGLTAEECDQVKTALTKVVTVFSAIPDQSFFRKSIWHEIDNFRRAYEDWNEPKGGEEPARQHRKNSIRKMQKARNAAATRIRKNMRILEKELDLILIEDSYEALGELTKAVPDIFRNLSKAIVRFEARKI